MINTSGAILYAYDGTTVGSAPAVSLNEYLGKTVYFDLTISNARREIKISLDGKNWVSQSSTVTLNWTSVNPQYYSLYVGKSHNAYWDGSLDLKWIEVFLDGVPVFNANKTGVGKHHPTNYITLGDPIISDNGVYTGGVSKGLIMPFTPAIATANSWEIQTACTYNRNDTHPPVFGSSSASDFQTPVLLKENGSWHFLLSSNGTSWNLSSSPISSFDMTEGVTYYLKCGFTGSQYYVDYNTDGSDNYTNIFTLASSTKCVCNVPLMFMNNGLNTSLYYNSGSMDLSKTKVIVNNKTVWELAPWINIPYTLSSTNSKIVDSYYRPQVQALYEQEGKALYYTLSDTDFTLPMGEIYGMMRSVPYDLMPDWSRIVNKVVNTSYVATQRGWIQSVGTTGQAEIGVYINGYAVARAYAAGEQDTCGYACLVPVDIGDIYTVSTPTDEPYVTVAFIPCKGEV